MPPAKPSSRARGGKKKVDGKTEKQEVSPKKGVKTASQNLTKTERGQGKKEETASKEKTKKDEGKEEQAEASDDEEIETSRQIARRKQNGKTGRVRAGRAKSKPEQKKTTAKSPVKGARKRGGKVVRTEEHESESEKAERSEQESQDEATDDKEEEPEHVKETAEAEASVVSSEEELLDADKKTEEEEEEEKEEETEINENNNEPPESEVKEEPVEEPVSSVDEVDSEEVLSDTGQESAPDETTGSLIKGSLNLTAHFQGQRKMLKSKILQKKRPSKKEEPKAGPSGGVQLKGMSFSKSGAAKGKSQILQLASKTKALNKTEEDTTEQEEQATDATKGRKGLLNRQSRMLFTMKGKGKDDKNKNAKEEPPKDSEKEIVEEAKQEVDEQMPSKSTERLVARKRGMATLRRVSGWIQKKMPKSNHVRRKLCAVTQAIGISKWLPALVAKKKSGSTKSKKNLIRHKMVMKMAKKNGASVHSNSETSKPQDAQSVSCDDPCTSKSQDLEEKANSGDAKYAIVLPRMNKIGKTTEAAVTSTTTSTENAPTTERKPPKPGARLVLPVKPDLSLLRSIKKIPQDGDKNITPKTQTNDGESELKVDNKKPITGIKDGTSVLQAAKGKLGETQLNFTKLSMSKALLNGGGSLERSREAEMNRRNADQSTEAETWRNGVRQPSFEEDVDREVAELMGNGLLPSAVELHWAQDGQMYGDPQDWMRSENLLPHQTVEKLTKWTVYQDDERAHTIPVHNGRGPWESEDPTQNMLEERLNSTQVASFFWGSSVGVMNGGLVTDS